MRLAHFSDLHLLALDGARPRDFLNKRWTGGAGLLLYRGRRYRADLFDSLVDDVNASGVDHVVFTGDVTNIALPAEFERGRERFDRLRAGPEGVTCIPGNHDVYVADAVGAFEAAFAPYVEADGEWGWPDRGPWPVVRVRGDLALIGLSTCLPTAWLMAHGRVGEPQLERLEAVLADPRLDDKFRVVLLHHPPTGLRARSPLRGLRDHTELAAVLRRAGAELVLHGHEHVPLAGALRGPEGVIPVRGAPSGSYDGVSGPRRAGYRIYTVDGGGPGRPRLAGEESRVWHRGQGAFVLT